MVSPSPVYLPLRKNRSKREKRLLDILGLIILAIIIYLFFSKGYYKLIKLNTPMIVLLSIFVILIIVILIIIYKEKRKKK